LGKPAAVPVIAILLRRIGSARAQDRVEAAERRIANDRMSNLNRGRAGLERAQRELHIIEAQLRLRGLLE
jgi:hypothetical protein